MKSNTAPLSPRIKQAASCLAIAGMLAVSATAQVQTDNFDNNPTLTGWATSVSANYPASLTFVPDAFGGKALRLFATNSAFASTPDLQNTARAILWMTNRYYTNNFYIAVDLVDWNSSPDRTTNDSVIGLVAHATNVVRDPSVPVGRPDGVILASATKPMAATLPTMAPADSSRCMPFPTVEHPGRSVGEPKGITPSIPVTNTGWCSRVPTSLIRTVLPPPTSFITDESTTLKI
jgi:hypothetical protein